MRNIIIFCLFYRETVYDAYILKQVWTGSVVEMPTNQFVNNMETLNNTIVMWKEIHIVYKNYAKYNIMAYYWQKLVQILFGSFSRGGVVRLEVKTHNWRPDEYTGM